VPGKTGIKQFYNLIPEQFVSVKMVGRQSGRDYFFLITNRNFHVQGISGGSEQVEK
jgi:hypothetical protein